MTVSFKSDAEVLAATKKVIDSVPADFKYEYTDNEKAAGTDIVSCEYFSGMDGKTPRCVVGKIAFELWGDIYTEIGTIFHNNGATLLHDDDGLISEQAARFFGAMQGWQDGGQSWHSAYDHAQSVSPLTA